MAQGRHSWMGYGAAGVMAAMGLMTAGTASAQNEGAISLEAKADVVTEYWFRGLGQQNKGIIFQPQGRLNIGLYEEADLSVDGYLRTFNSIHDRNTDSSRGMAASNWYQTDFTAGVDVGLPGDFTVGAGWKTYYSPSGGGHAADEVLVYGSYDDSALMEEMGIDFSINPHVLIAIETAGGGLDNDASDRGSYLELGVRPEFEVYDHPDYPITLAVPTTVGFSISDYYQDMDGDSSTFGFIDIGAVGSTPLPFIPQEYGQWDANAGLHLMWLGESANDIARERGLGSNNFNIYGSVGLSMAY